MNIDFAIISRSVEDTIKLGHVLAESIKPGDILAFSGNLGAGKTSLIQGICQGLGVSKDIYITSPTFVILNRYKGRLYIYHFDFYRLSLPEEIIDLGYEEYFFSQGVCLIEWAERATSLLPEDYLKINLYTLSPIKRKIEFFLYGEDYKKRFSKLSIHSGISKCPSVKRKKLPKA